MAEQDLLVVAGAMEKVLEELFGALLSVARSFRYPFRCGSITFHVAGGKLVKTEYSIHVK